MIKTKKRGYLFLLFMIFSLSYLMINEKNIPVKAEMLKEGSVELLDFRYQALNNSVPDIGLPMGNYNELIIDFANGTFGDLKDELRIYFAQNKNAYGYGPGCISIDFTDINGTEWQYTIYKGALNLQINASIPNYLDMVENSFINYVSSNHIDWIKAQNFNYSHGSNNIGPIEGIDEFTVKSPELITENDQTEVKWGIQFKSITSKPNQDGTVDWNINSSIIQNYTYHFYLKSQAAFLKIDYRFLDLYVDPSMKGSQYEDGNLTSTSNLICWNQYVDGTDVIYNIDGQELNESHYFPPGDGRLINNTAAIKVENKTISEINFGKNYTLNNASVCNITNCASVGLVPPDNFRELNFIEKFSNINFTEFTSIDMDPEVSFYIFAPQEDSLDDPDGINGYSLILFLGIISIIGIVLIFKSRTQIQ